MSNDQGQSSCNRVYNFLEQNELQTTDGSSNFNASIKVLLHAEKD